MSRQKNIYRDIYIYIYIYICGHHPQMPTFCREFIIALRPFAYSTLICIGLKMVQFRSAISKVLCFHSHVFFNFNAFEALWGAGEGGREGMLGRCSNIHGCD